MSELMQFIEEQILLVGVLIALIAMLAFNVVNQILKKHQDLSTAAAVRLMDDKNLNIIDVREDKEKKVGIIATAKHIKMSEIKTELTKLNKSHKVLIYCRSGHRSDYACRQFTKAGFEHVYNLKGGFNAWLKDSLPIKKIAAK